LVFGVVINYLLNLYVIWEHISVVDLNLIFYILFDEKREGKSVQVMLLSTDKKHQNMKPEVWLSSPNSYVKAEFKLK